MDDIRFEIAQHTEDCNASLFIKDCLSDIWPELTYAQKKDIVRAKQNDWQVQQGELARMYTWEKGGPEEIECVEIPAMAKICTALDLWPQQSYFEGD